MAKTDHNFQQALHMYICNIIRKAYKFKICTAKTKDMTFYRSEHMRAKKKNY